MSPETVKELAPPTFYHRIEFKVCYALGSIVVFIASILLPMKKSRRIND